MSRPCALMLVFTFVLSGCEPGLQITEVWPAQRGDNYSAEWFEITNFGDSPWDMEVAPLFYEDASHTVGEGDIINGIAAIAPGESVVIVIGSSEERDDFINAWTPLLDLANTQVGHTGGHHLNRKGCDTIRIWFGAPAGEPALVAGVPATHGVSYDYDIGNFSTNGNSAGAKSLLHDEVVVTASPGTTYSANRAPFAPQLTVDIGRTYPYLDLPRAGGGAITASIGDPTDPAAIRGIDFRFSDSDHSSTALDFTVLADNDTVNLHVTGSGARRNLRIVPAQIGYTRIVATVTDPAGNTDTYPIHYTASAASSTPENSRFHMGAADASAAIPLGGMYMLVANDEDETIRLYDRLATGFPLAVFPFNCALATRKEADLEAVIRQGNRLYWIGSHGHPAPEEDNEDDDDDPSVEFSYRDTVFSTEIIGDGPAVQLSLVNPEQPRYKDLMKELVDWDEDGDHGLGEDALGLDESTDDSIPSNSALGFNIEGAARIGDTVYLGFRGPMQDTDDRDKALVIPVENFMEVVDTGEGDMEFGAPIFLDLHGRVIRDMAGNSNGEILILAGPADNGTPPVPSFEFYRWTIGETPERWYSSLNQIAVDGMGSPEAIVEVPPILEDGARVQVLLDNGRTDYYGDGLEAKKIPPYHQKFRSDWVVLHSPGG